MATETQATTAPPDEGGLPQFDTQWWPGQIVWFLIIFIAMLVVFRLFAAPRVGGAIEGREHKINGDIADARRMKDEAEAQAQAAAAETAPARAAAHRVAAEARAAAEVKAAAGELAAQMAEQVLASRIAGAKSDPLIDAAIGQLAGYC